MGFEHKLLVRLIANLLPASFFLSICYAAPAVDYANPLGDARWKMTGNPIRCGLSLVIPQYGVGYFEQYATKDPHFILRTWQPVQRSLPLQVIVNQPVWKPLRKESWLVAKSYVKPGDFGIYLTREPALKLLTFLSKGYQTQFNYRSEEGFNVSLFLSPVRFQPAYTKYQQCLASLLPFNYSKVKESIFHFGVDSKTLTEEDRAQLKRIAAYVAADVNIEAIKVVGYADESGRKGYNNAISQFRAEAVKNYLMRMGVPKSKLSVTWVGALQPVARNDTDSGRAANRRVVVTLIKK